MSKEKGKSAVPQLAEVDIGALLANKRKQKNISLERAAKTINLPTHIVEKLENDDFVSIGAPVYVRGYLSLYAKYLGFDVAEIVQLYNTQYPTDNGVLRSALPPIKGMVKKERKRHSKTLSLLVSILFLSSLLYGYYRFEPVFFDKVIGKNDTTLVKKETIETSSVDNANLLIDETKKAQNLADDVLNGRSITDNKDLANDIDMNAIELESVSEVADNTDVLKEDKLYNSEILTVTEAKEKPKAIIENTKANVEDSSLKITFSDDCWLKITDADGKVVAVGIYTAKRPLEVRGKLPMKLNTARVSAIKLVTLDGKKISLESNRLSKRRFEIK